MLCLIESGRGNKNVDRVGCARIESASAEKTLLSASSSVSPPRFASARSNRMRGTMNGNNRTNVSATAPAVASTICQLRRRSAATPTITPYARPPKTRK